MTNEHIEHLPPLPVVDEAVVISVFSEMYNSMIHSLKENRYDFSYIFADTNFDFTDLFTASNDLSWRDRIKNNRIFCKVNSTTRKIFRSTKKFITSKETMISACAALWGYCLVSLFFLALFATSIYEIISIAFLAGYLTYAMFSVILTLSI